MTAKDYRALAGAILTARATFEDGGALTRSADAALTLVAAKIADALAADNARFDRARFLAACGEVA
jgi:hypothetical protein